jgi:PTH2 family peptidyl-tRNA hydrolase
MPDPTPKQVIVMRTDLSMRKGKMIAQGAHASLKVFLDLLKWGDRVEGPPWPASLEVDVPTYAWMTESFTKICVGVDSEAELLRVYEEAKAWWLPCALIEDNGLTEFHGVVTKTCCAIGPAWPSDIDPITGSLKLL